MMKRYIRKPLYNRLLRSLTGQPNYLQAVVGPRQVGKTTLALQLLERWNGPKRYESADQPDTPSRDWIVAQWEKIRDDCRGTRKAALLVLDEIQKIPRWSTAVKRCFDEDRRRRLNIRVVLLGSSALLMQKGLSESLAGRFEVHRHHQWSFEECRECFSLSLEEYLYFGGYPGALALRKDETRWAHYVRDSLIETVLSKDILLMAPVSKPALLRQAFGLAVRHPAEIMSYQKMQGSLQDAGNTTTLASYLHLLEKAFLIAPLERWSGSRVRQRGSIPKILVMDNGLCSAMRDSRFGTFRRDRQAMGRVVENAVGIKLYFEAQSRGGELFYWRERDFEIDYILKIGNRIVAIEVKTGSDGLNVSALEAFRKKNRDAEFRIITPPMSGSAAKTVQPYPLISLKEFFGASNVPL